MSNLDSCTEFKVERTYRFPVNCVTCDAQELEGVYRRTAIRIACFFSESPQGVDEVEFWMDKHSDMRIEHFVQRERVTFSASIFIPMTVAENMNHHLGVFDLEFIKEMSRTEDAILQCDME